MSRLPPQAQLDWTPDGPRSAAFDDIYFSRRGGLDESDAVYLAGCRLPEAWAGRNHFAICELGFGTGLNVLAAWRAWRLARDPHAQLHIFSVEACPLAVADAARALAAFPEIAPLAEKLLARWPVQAYAPQRLWFPEDGFALTLVTGQAEQVLPTLTGPFDAWFLDGFAPSRNPGMWSEALFREIARLSAPGAAASTFTVAGVVRRGLEAAGFAVAKKPGHGGKRERLEARLVTPPPQAAPLYPTAPAPHGRVAIIGAGIAGAACARALARRNIETIVLDAAPELGAGASGNPAGLVMPRLDRDGALRELFLAAYLEAVAAYGDLGPDVFTPCGVLQRADDALADLLNDPPLPPDWFKRQGADALHVRAGVARPQAAIRAWLSDAELMLEATIASLERARDGWLLRAEDGRARLKADAVVLACGPALTRFEPAAFLPLKLSHGQIEWGAVASPPAHAIVDGNYVAPFDGGVIFGATFDHDPADEANARTRNLAALSTLAPELAAQLDLHALHSRAALRVTTPDHAPIAGLLPDAPAWRERFAGLAHGQAPDLSTPAPAHTGVYVIGSLGARGLTLAPLLGERIAAEICGEPQALSAKTLDAISPARFLHRALRRGG